jgi:hypothetical protein
MVDFNEIPNSTKKLHKNTIFEIFKKPKGVYLILLKNDDLWFIKKKNKNTFLSDIDKFLYPKLRDFENLIKKNIKSIPNGKHKFCVDLINDSFIGFSNLNIDGIIEDKPLYKGLLNFDMINFGINPTFKFENLFIKSADSKFCFRYLVSKSDYEKFDYKPLVLFFNDIVDNLPDKMENLKESHDTNLIFNISKIFVKNYNDLYKNYDISDFVYKSFIETKSDWEEHLPYDLKIMIQDNFNILYQFKFILCLFNKSNIKSDIFLSDHHKNKYYNFFDRETNIDVYNK